MEARIKAVFEDGSILKALSHNIQTTGPQYITIRFFTNTISISFVSNNNTGMFVTIDTKEIYSFESNTEEVNVVVGSKDLYQALRKIKKKSYLTLLYEGGDELMIENVSIPIGPTEKIHVEHPDIFHEPNLTIPTTIFSEFFKQKSLTWTGWTHLIVRSKEGNITFSTVNNHQKETLIGTFDDTHPLCKSNKSSEYVVHIPLTIAKTFKKTSNIAPPGSKVSFYFANLKKKDCMQIVVPLGTFGAYVIAFLPE